MSTDISRRAVLAGAAGAAGGLAMSATATGAEPAKAGFGYCLNTSTVRGNNLGIGVPPGYPHSKCD